jgi:hypothetical protein
VTGEAHGIVVAPTSDQSIVSKTAVDEIASSSSIEDIILLVANEFVTARGPDYILNAFECIDRDLGKRLAIRSRYVNSAPVPLAPLRPRWTSTKAALSPGSKRWSRE